MALRDFWWPARFWAGQADLGQLPRERPPPDRPKFRAFFFPSPAIVFIISSLSWEFFRGILVVFLNSGTMKCARLGSRAVL